MTPLYIFDLDGTLADISHRRHFVEGTERRWPEFYRACVDDVPNEPVLRTLRFLYGGGADIWIWSGRSDEVLRQTELWLAAQSLYPHEEYGELRMRPAGDYTPDDALKRKWYESLAAVDKERLVAVFDDRDRMVRMWREIGVACFQVAPGDF
jgi:hypothetical protein